MPTDLKLENYSDRELLHMLDDLSGEDGWVDLDVMAARIGIRVDGLSHEQTSLHARRCVAVRLSWIRRLTGCVERNPIKSARSWRLTVSGEEVTKAKIASNIEDALGSMGDFSTLQALDALSRRYRRADRGAANLMRREWLYGTHRRRSH